MRKYRVKITAAKWFIWRNLIFRRSPIIVARNSYKAKKQIERQYKIFGIIEPDWIIIDTIEELSL